MCGFPSNGLWLALSLPLAPSRARCLYRTAGRGASSDGRISAQTESSSLTSFDGFGLNEAITRAIAEEEKARHADPDPSAHGPGRHVAPRAGRKPIMFKILELKGNSTQAAEVGRRHSRREEALAAVKKHLKTFKASGHNPEANYWWARDSEGLRKCWIASTE